MARPSDYSSALADIICERIADGESLRKVCASEEMPARSTIFKWLSQHKEFSDQYARAKEEQADTLFDDILSIADQYDTLSEAVNPDLIQRAKLRIDARKWMAGKLRPKKYGEKLELSGDSESPLQVVINRFSGK